jgi:hypothetical protein
LLDVSPNHPSASSTADPPFDHAPSDSPGAQPRTSAGGKRNDGRESVGPPFPESDVARSVYCACSKCVHAGWEGGIVEASDDSIASNLRGNWLPCRVALAPHLNRSRGDS